MGRLIDISGKKFGRLTVLNRVGKDKSNVSLWECVCECGKNKIVRSSSLREGRTRSCGCLHIESTINRSFVHGYSVRNKYNYLFRFWKAALDRCNNCNHKFYKDYGGRGIKMYDLWEKDVNLFIRYVEKVLGDRPSKDHSIDRIDNNKGYIPGNLKWSSQKEQVRNRRSVKLSVEEVFEIRNLYSCGGVTQKELAKRFNISQSHISAIIRYKKWI